MIGCLSPKYLLAIVCSFLSATLAHHGWAAEAIEWPSSRVHAFYYPWYGNPETDGKFENWNHAVAVRQGPPRLADPGAGGLAALHLTVMEL